MQITFLKDGKQLRKIANTNLGPSHAHTGAHTHTKPNKLIREKERLSNTSFYILIFYLFFANFVYTYNVSEYTQSLYFLFLNDPNILIFKNGLKA